MKILAIETSCDETGVAIIEASDAKTAPNFKILANIVASQIAVHAPWGGVVPNLAKREHERNLVPVLLEALERAEIKNKELGITGMLGGEKRKAKSEKQQLKIKKILEREQELQKEFFEKILPLAAPEGIDAIAVTHGPGLEPALWVGVNFARALATLWNKPLVPVNHMEGHIFSFLLSLKTKNLKLKTFFPAIALLISGGHTELVLVKGPTQYKYLGGTRDDAVGEAFDKVAKLLGLGYPGGPLVSKLAASATPTKGSPRGIIFPRPMLHSPDLDFSFSGLKTSVLYKVRELKNLDEKIKAAICREFEDAALDVLIHKTLRAAEKYRPRSIILGGGVSANSALRARLTKTVRAKLPAVKLILPELKFTGDNAAMIAVATYFNLKKAKRPSAKITAQGTLNL
ncbi:MAG: tRNA (adenosine(37)-N6)-threonylcarbamoyltransferase complex transferase subunit TsaD [Candidatus Niyogibacteria bacterium]|nr:tRNA (adenosine(37)-N6)-threonylcarbamoyltransferase complex transferase subunit TsaD [Candidatus Niyogibacteria bacterium]